jgi:hypothetical protein
MMVAGADIACCVLLIDLLERNSVRYLEGLVQRPLVAPTAGTGNGRVQRTDVRERFQILADAVAMSHSNVKCNTYVQ